MEFKLDQTAHPMQFLMIASSDHISPALGLSPTVVISKNGGTFATPAGSITEIGNGWYKVTPDADDFDTLGPLLLHATSASADPTDVESFQVTSGLVDLGPIQHTSIVGNIQGAVGSVTSPVTCSVTPVCKCKCKCKKKGCS